MDKYCIDRPFGEIFFTTSGGTPSRKNKSYFKGHIPWVKSGELENNIIYDSEERITEEALNASSAKIFPKETVLLALYGATIGKLAVLGIDASTNQAVCGVFENKYLNHKYLYYFLLFRRPQLISQGIGGAQPNISQGILQKQNFPIRSIPEQEQLVSIIEQLFSDLDNAIDNLKKAKDQLKTYRQAVLKYAFEGRFSSKQKELKLLNIFDFSVATPISWKTGKLSELGEFSRGKSKHRPRNDPSLFGKKYPFIQTGEISKAENRRIRSYSKAYNDTGLKQSRLWKKGTLCITIAANIAKTAILGIDACFPDSVVGFNSTSDHTTKFVMYYIDLIQQYLDDKASATAQKNININILTQLDFPVPDFKIQLAVVSEIESRFSVCDKMEETINNSLDQAEALRQSILKQAFEGKLTEQWRKEHPELITGENSAMALLERIKKEREQLKISKKRKS